MSSRRPGDLPGDVDDLYRKVEAIQRVLGNSLPRIIYGHVSSTGSISRAGSGGWTSVRNSIGNYTVTFTIAFISSPFVLLTPNSGVITRVSGTPTTTSVTISTLDAAFANADFDTTFLAVGV